MKRNKFQRESKKIQLIVLWTKNLGRLFLTENNYYCKEMKYSIVLNIYILLERLIPVEIESVKRKNSANIIYFK